MALLNGEGAKAAGTQGPEAGETQGPQHRHPCTIVTIAAVDRPILADLLIHINQYAAGVLCESHAIVGDFRRSQAIQSWRSSVALLRPDLELHQPSQAHLDLEAEHISRVSPHECWLDGSCGSLWKDPEIGTCLSQPTSASLNHLRCVPASN
jgi:hypothetical protein